MLALYRSGRQADALAAYRRAFDVLGGELGLEPGPRLRDLQAAILVHDPALELPTRPMAIPGRVPRAPTATVGRQAELADVVALVRDDDGARVVTLVGPGGVGKTRVAIEAVGSCAWSSPTARGSSRSPSWAAPRPSPPRSRGRWRSSSCPEKGPRRRWPAGFIRGGCCCARQLRARTGGRAGHRRPRRERRGCDSPRHQSRVASLARRARPAVEPLPPAHAVTLFGASARAAGHLLTEGDARPAEVICARLDGLPLAIELAAGWTGTLAPSELLKRLDQALPLLVGGARDQPERQQTLRSTIEWSHRLLDAMGQRAFARFAVFPQARRSRRPRT